MTPHLIDFHKGESGIRRVVEAYFRHLPEFGIKLVDKNATTYDLSVAHAGATGGEADVSHCHGLYWSADLECPAWEHEANKKVIDSIRHAREVTVPSTWVAETFQRDMRFTPHIIPHGIEWSEWQHNESNQGYVLWNKNRSGSDVCETDTLGYLAEYFPQQLFLSTFPTLNMTPNVRATGVVPHNQMKLMVQQAGIYLNTAKETFGIGILEAMASGVPVLAYGHGGALDLVQHGVNGYLAEPGDRGDLAAGLMYCLEHRDTLGANGRELAKKWTWEAACELVAKVYQLASREQPPTVAIIIPSYNYSNIVGRAIESAIRQSYEKLNDVIIVDDGSNDDGETEKVVKSFQDDRIRFIRQNNAGVAIARNRGISETNAKYIACLDADDSIESTFLEKLIPFLEADESLGVVYSSLRVELADGRRMRGGWPSDCNFDKHVVGENQVPTCCVFRRKAWERLGGYKQRYAPDGCGSEDAEFWLRMGLVGWGIKRVTKETLFNYSLGGYTTGNKNFKEVNWLQWHPEVFDEQYPFASVATPKNGMAHLVRQYDEPLVSIVIPVGPGHEQVIENALDSLEAQTFRRWEAIVAWDLPTVPDSFLKAYPYIRFRGTVDCETGKENSKGSGFARNRGAELARAPFLLFLDADDWLYPDFLERCLNFYGSLGYEAGVYTDHVGKAIVGDPNDPNLAKDLRQRVYDWNPKTQEAVIGFVAQDYNWQRATRQPDVNDMYIWNLITTLIPTYWHSEIGGFDETMPTWEDWDYWLRLARIGKCFERLDEELVVYQMHSGNRREIGVPFSGSRQIVQSVVKYMQEKYGKEEPLTPCKGCGGGRSMKRPNYGGVTKRASRQEDDNEYVLILYTHPNRGQHPVHGPVTREFYDYRCGGDKFLVNRADVWDSGGRKVARYFEPVVEEAAPSTLSRPKREVPPPKAPDLLLGIELSSPPPVIVEQPPSTKLSLSNVIDLQTLPGINLAMAAAMTADGLDTVKKILAAGPEGLTKYKGIGLARATTIIEMLQQET